MSYLKNDTHKDIKRYNTIGNLINKSLKIAVKLNDFRLLQGAQNDVLTKAIKALIFRGKMKFYNKI